jgi:hypothetical protein
VDSCISEPEKTHRDWAKNNDERPTKSHVKQRPETGINRAVSTGLQYSNVDKAFELLGGLLDDPEFSIDGNPSNTPRVLTWNHSPVENNFLQGSHIASGKAIAEKERIRKKVVCNKRESGKKSTAIRISRWIKQSARPQKSVQPPAPFAISHDTAFTELKGLKEPFNSRQDAIVAASWSRVMHTKLAKNLVGHS